MKSWQEDLLGITDHAQCTADVFSRIEAAAQALGFEHCAYGLRLPLPVSNPKTIILDNYPTAWRDRYSSANYLQLDPTVAHGRRHQTPLVWNARANAHTARFWDEANSFGLCFGWAQSTINAVGVGGMLTLSRSSSEVTPGELETQEIKMRWLGNVAHQTLSRMFVANAVEPARPDLTAREVEVLKWTADGKTSSEISTLLSVSENTVNFHVKNAVTKLNTANKTAAVVRAVVLGLLN